MDQQIYSLRGVNKTSICLFFHFAQHTRAPAIDKWRTLFHSSVCPKYFLHTNEQYVAYGEYFPEKQMIVASCLAVFDRILFPKSRGRLYRLKPLLSLYHI